LLEQRKKKTIAGTAQTIAGAEVRGGCGFSSLMKQKIKGKNCAVFCFAGKRKICFFYL
jgi:hypothetical protein